MSFLQTLAAAFKGGGDRVPLARSFNSPWAFADTGAPRVPFEYRGSVGRAYIDNPVAQRAVRLVAEGIGGAPLLETDPDLARLVATTSAGQSLLETLASHLLLHGNGYVQIMKDARGRPVELFALRPERMSVIAGSDGWPTAYAYRVGEQSLTIPVLDEDASPNVIHIRHFHPTDDHYGAGCLAAAEQAVATHNAAAVWNRSLLENAARPSGALVYEAGDTATLTPDQFDRLKAELARAFSGENNAGRPMLLEGGLKWQSMSMTPADMDFATLKAAAARDIALAFGVPPMLLGLPGDSTYSNYREANRALWRLTLLPLSAKLFAALLEGLEPWYPDARLAIDLDRVPALAEDRERLWAQVTDADFLTDAEKRALLGLPEAPAEQENNS
ncbi:portal protein [Novosphingobium marinum]|uniref:HK97 family phage portal protein n=1 Tax=Novosphingobium marinum TaxID=1514948 RepID=A0A7Z0BUZ1_9SPHN|nr:phage portal protein [Novosphingobium marinum]NYH94702.1 HK97 family phage portal protein [Novosphingobium marinum]GGC38057.1 portal protein [Novosphingobium marinum]